MNINDVLDKTLYCLEDIIEYENVGVYNMWDISVEEDESFVLSNGVLSHNSALGPSLKVRNPVTTGFFPLRGVVMNTWSENASTVLKNKELSELMAILNVKISDPESFKDMEYDNISIMADADHDGEKISTLLVGFFYKYWPKMIEQGKLSIIRSPIMISSNKKDTKWFYSYEEANKFKETSNGYKHRYIKGLASLEEHEYDVIINDPVVDVIKIDDPSMFEMMFGEDTKLRKEFMMA